MKGPESPAIQPVTEVTGVTAQQVALNKLTLVISAKGKVPTSGWTKVSLAPIHFDGTDLHLAFVGEPPPAGADVISDVEASLAWTAAAPPRVVVHAARNAKIASVPR